MKLKSINIVKVVITPTGYCLVTTEDYGDAFLIPLHQSSNRVTVMVTLQKPKNSLLTASLFM